MLMAAWWKEVITLGPEDVAAASRRLIDALLVEGFRPDGVLGIASGGVSIAYAAAEYCGATTMTCRLQRPSTAGKRKNPIIKLLPHVPYWISNSLRRFEDWFLGVAPRAPQAPAGTESVLEIQQALDTIRRKKLKRILVVDDAVDSGSTMMRVAAALEELRKDGVEVRTGAIVVSRSEPAYMPDLRIYFGVLCRFPWSHDYTARA